MPVQMDNYQEQIRKIEKLGELIGFADRALQTTDGDIRRHFRSSVEMVIMKIYGPLSIAYKNYRKIDHWDSIHSIREMKGLLQAMKEDLEFDIQQTSTDDTIQKHSKSNHPMDFLSQQMLDSFYKNQIDNLESLQNLVRFDSRFYAYNVEDVAAIFEKFKERSLIAYTGVGEAYCIAAEGKKLYERLNQKATPQDQSVAGTKKSSAESVFLYDAFFCHSSFNKPIIRKIIADFKAIGIRYWFDDEQIRPGDNILAKMTEGLQNSRNIIVCISEELKNSNWAAYEYQSVMTDTITGVSIQKIIPFIIDDTPDHEIPQFLKLHRRERYQVEDEYLRLLKAVTPKY